MASSVEFAGELQGSSAGSLDGGRQRQGLATGRLKAPDAGNQMAVALGRSPVLEALEPRVLLSTTLLESALSLPMLAGSDESPAEVMVPAQPAGGFVAPGEVAVEHGSGVQNPQALFDAKEPAIEPTGGVLSSAEDVRSDAAATGTGTWYCSWDPDPDYFLTDLNWVKVTWNVSGAPAGATVTSIEYRLWVGEEDSGQTDFYCADYVISMSSGVHGEDWSYYRAWNHAGGRTDGGYDDDTADDYDIYLNHRSTSAFNGEAVNQIWYWRVSDEWSGDDGKVNYIEFWINYQYPEAQPDLQVSSYVWPGGTIQEGDPHWVQAEVYNGGTASAGASYAKSWLSTDTVLDASDYYLGEKPVDALAVGASDWVTWDFTMPDLGSGTYDVYVFTEVDSRGQIAESNENNLFRSTSPFPVEDGPAPWVVAYYLSHGNNLDAFQPGKFTAIANGASNPNVRAVVLYDFLGSTQDAVYQITAGLTNPGSYTRNVNMWWTSDVGLGAEASMGDDATLITFMNWVVDHYSADNYALVLFDHGSGWESTSALPGEPMAAPTGICWDGGDYLTTGELGTAFAAIDSHRGENIEVTHFDACLMQMIEVAYEVRNHTDYVVANANLGWVTSPSFEANYLTDITSATSSVALAVDIASNYHNWLAAWGSGALGHTVSVLDMSRVNDVYLAVQTLSSQLLAAMTVPMSPGDVDHFAEIRTARINTQKYDEDGDGDQDAHDAYVDLKHFAQRLQNDITGSDTRAVQLRSAAQALEAAMDSNYVRYNASTNASGYSFPNALGQSIYFPENESHAWLDYYNGTVLDFCDGNWDEFLDAYLPPDLTAPYAWWQSSSVYEGAPFWIRFEIENRGSSTAESSRVRAYLSTDNDFDTSDDYALAIKSVGTLGAGSSQNVQWDFTMPDLGSGSYTVWMLAEVDYYDEVTEYYESNTWKIFDGFTAHDAVSPAPTAVDLLAGSDTGRSNSDDTTRLDNSTSSKVLQFVVSGTVPGATVTLYADSTAIGSAVAGGTSTTVTTNGSYDMVDGSHSFTARQTEPGKLPSPDSPSLAVWIDTAAPTGSTPDLDPASDTGSSNSDDVTQGVSPEFSGTASDPTSGGYASGVWKVEVSSDDGKVSIDSTSPFFSVTLPTLDEGNRTVTATVYDVAGNTYTTAPLAVVVDRTAPRLAAFGLSSTSAGWALETVDSLLWTTDRDERTAPWSVIDRLVVDFNEVVVSDPEGLAVSGVLNGTVSLTGPNGADTRLVWTTGDYLTRDRYRMVLAGGVDGVQDIAGNALDGEPHGDVFPSGDGAPGGDWTFDLNVLVGDCARGDGVVNVIDKARVRLLYGAENGAPEYDRLADFNGDHVINVIDKALVRLHYGEELPPPPPTTPPTAAAGPAEVRLDGEPHGDVFPSGDGAPGGDWTFDLNALVGDCARGDGVVNVIDKARVSLLYGAVHGAPEYDRLADFNGDSRIDTLDRAQVIRNLGKTLPPAPPSGLASSGGSRPAALAKVDVLATASPVGRMPASATGGLLPSLLPDLGLGVLAQRQRAAGGV